MLTEWLRNEQQISTKWSWLSCEFERFLMKRLQEGISTQIRQYEQLSLKSKIAVLQLKECPRKINMQVIEHVCATSDSTKGSEKW